MRESEREERDLYKSIYQHVYTYCHTSHSEMYQTGSKLYMFQVYTIRVSPAPR